MVLLRAFLVYESGKEILTCFNNVIKLVPISAVTNVLLLLLMINPKVINKTISEFIISSRYCNLTKSNQKNIYLHLHHLLL